MSKRTWRGCGAAAVVTVTFLVATAPSADAASVFVQSGGSPIAGPFNGSGDGHLHHQRHVAADFATDNLLRTDVVEDRVAVYAPGDFVSGFPSATFGSGELSDPHGIAVDQSNGDVYVSDAGNDRIVRYTTDGQPVPAYTLDPTFVSPALGSGTGEVGSFAASLAVDPTSGKLWVADPGNDVVKRFTDTGAYDGFSIDGTGSPGTFTGVQDLAVDSTGDVIVVDSDGGDPADGATSRVERFNADGSWEATLGPVENAANVAVRPFDDEVIVSGNQDAVNSDQSPTLFVFDATSSAELAFGPPAFFHLYSTISGLTVGDGPNGQLFVATDNSRGLYPGLYGAAAIAIFDPPPQPIAPAIGPPVASISNVTYDSATLRATVYPGGAETTYRFEYGPTTAYGSSTAPASAGEGRAPVAVTAELDDLDPSITYHFRLVADNGIGGGPVADSDRTFRTLDAPALVTIGDPVAVGSTSVTLQGAVDNHDAPASYRFHVIQTDGPRTQATADVALDPAAGPRAVSAVIDGLRPGGTYRVRLSATTSGGTRYSGDTYFSTAPPPAFQAAPPELLDPTPYGCDAIDCSTGSDSEPRPPSNRFRIDLRKGAVLGVRVPGKGTLLVTGSGVRSVVKRPARGGTVRVTLTLTKSGRQRLARSRRGKLRTVVEVRYRPAGGRARTVSRSVNFRRDG